MSYTVESEKLQKFVVTIKYLQFIFLSVLFYGTAMLSYDLIKLVPGIEISAWSIGCTIFGGEGAIVSYFIIRSTEKKIKKLIKQGKKIE